MICTDPDKIGVVKGKIDYSNTPIEAEIKIGDTFVWLLGCIATITNIRQYPDGKTFTVKLLNKIIKGLTINDLIRCGWRPVKGVEDE